MKWQLAALVFLAWFVGAAISLAPAQFNGCPAGFCSRIGSVAPAGYQGPGDVVSGAVAWWGLRCYNTAYTGNVADVYAPVDASHTLLTCSVGGTINQTLQALSITCAVSCTIKTLYDQTGNGNDITQATEANRPTFSATPLVCSVFTSANSTFLSGGTTVTLSTPLTYSTVVNISNDGGVVIGYFGLNLQTSGPDNVRMFDGTNVLDATVLNGSLHALQAIDGGSGAGASQIYDNGSTTTGTLSGSGTTGGFSIVVGSSNGFAGFLDGSICELGLWNVDFTSPDRRAAMTSNQRTYWGF